MLRYLCALLLVSSALSAPRELADGHDVVVIDVECTKAAGGADKVQAACYGICAFATSSTAQVFVITDPCASARSHHRGYVDDQTGDH